MRVLLIAYEYPPIIAAQALRWYYLANELAALGVEVDVLTPKIQDIWHFADHNRPEIKVYRCFPGPFVALSGWLSGRLGQGSTATASTQIHRSALSLQSLYTAIRRVLNHLLFPDVRTEWLWFAWRKLKRFYPQRRYDIVISSHEPGVDLLLGLRAQTKWHVPWIIDLADPVLTPYTPRWRRRLDKNLERRVCKRADHILVTAEPTRELLTARHGINNDRFTILSQGFDIHSAESAIPDPAPAENQFLLVYTGTFYRGFRDPSEWFAVLANLPHLHCVIAGHVDSFAPYLAALGERVTLLGKLDHRDCLVWQRRATVLVNLGNRQSYQVPGKLYEYFGACRPILHIRSNAETDPAAVLVESLRRGVVVPNRHAAIREQLETLYTHWQAGTLDESFDLSLEAVRDHTWTRRAARLRALCDTLHAN